MAQTTYQVILSTDGKHTVIATTDDQGAIKGALTWARATYEKVVVSLWPQRASSPRGMVNSPTRRLCPNASCTMSDGQAAGQAWRLLELPSAQR